MQNVVDRLFPKRTYIFMPQAYELSVFENILKYIVWPVFLFEAEIVLQPSW